MSEIQTKQTLKAERYTQWEPGVDSPGSACGPATMASLVEYWHTRMGRSYVPGRSHFQSKAAHINHIYKHYGGTPFGMSVRSFINGVKAYLRTEASREEMGNSLISLTLFNDMERFRAEIDADRPVAIKFDKWFSFRWRGSYTYDYHWVLGVGYDESEHPDDLVLIVHDNGVRLKNGGFSPCQERRISYKANRDILTMVALNIEEKHRPPQK